MWICLCVCVSVCVCECVCCRRHLLPTDFGMLFASLSPLFLSLLTHTHTLSLSLVFAPTTRWRNAGSKSKERGMALTLRKSWRRSSWRSVPAPCIMRMPLLPNTHTHKQTNTHNTHTCIFPSASASFPSPCTQVAQRRSRIVEHMRDVGKLHKGRVTVRAFRSALSMCSLNLTLPEYRALERVCAAQEGLLSTSTTFASATTRTKSLATQIWSETRHRRARSSFPPPNGH